MPTQIISCCYMLSICHLICNKIIMTIYRGWTRNKSAPLVQIKLEFESVAFVEGGTPEDPDKTLGAGREQTTNSTNTRPQFRESYPREPLRHPCSPQIVISQTTFHNIEFISNQMD